MEALKTKMSYYIPERKSILRQQYRTSIGIMSEILQIVMDAGRQGVIVSEVARKANLSHKVTVEYCHKLSGALIIETARTKRNHIFIITSKGIDFVHAFKRFLETVQEMNLQCLAKNFGIPSETLGLLTTVN